MACDWAYARRALSTGWRPRLPSSAPPGRRSLVNSMSTSPLKLAVLVSGSGTTLQNLIDLIAAGQLDARVEVVLASRPGIKGIDRAAAAGLRHFVAERARFGDVAEFSRQV